MRFASSRSCVTITAVVAVARTSASSAISRSCNSQSRPVGFVQQQHRRSGSDLARAIPSSRLQLSRSTAGSESFRSTVVNSSYARRDVAAGHRMHPRLEAMFATTSGRNSYRPETYSDVARMGRTTGDVDAVEHGASGIGPIARR